MVCKRCAVEHCNKEKPWDLYRGVMLNIQSGLQECNVKIVKKDWRNRCVMLTGWNNGITYQR